MEPTMYQVEGKYFGKVERWPTKYISRESAEEEAKQLRDRLPNWTGWTFSIAELMTDA
jgi:hypothetical protein